MQRQRKASPNTSEGIERISIKKQIRNERNYNICTTTTTEVLSSYKYMFYASYFFLSLFRVHTEESFGDGDLPTHPCARLKLSRHQFHHVSNSNVLQNMLAVSLNQEFLFHVKSACVSSVKLPF